MSHACARARVRFYTRCSVFREPIDHEPGWLATWINSRFILKPRRLTKREAFVPDDERMIDSCERILPEARS